MILSKVSKKWLVTIPAEVRRRLGIEEGDYLAWEVDEKHDVIVVRVIKDPLRILEGKYDDSELTYDEVEGMADEILLRKAHASNRAWYAHSPCQ